MKNKQNRKKLINIKYILDYKIYNYKKNHILIVVNQEAKTATLICLNHVETNQYFKLITNINFFRKYK